MRRYFVVLSLLAMSALAKDRPTVKVQVVLSKFWQETNLYHDPGSAGYTSTTCSINSTGDCVFHSEGARSPQDYTITVGTVELLIALPDDTTAYVRCTTNQRYCATLQAAAYPAEAKGDMFRIHFPIPVGRPEYTTDGRLLPRKVRWVSEKYKKYSPRWQRYDNKK